MKDMDESNCKNPIISITMEEAVSTLCDYHENNFGVDDIVGFSVSIDASKVASNIEVRVMLMRNIINVLLFSLIHLMIHITP